MMLKKTNMPLLAMLLGLSLVFTQSAFKSNTSTQYWFAVNTSTGAIGAYTGHSAPGGDCSSSNPSLPICSVAFDESDIANPSSPVSPISNAASDPNNLIKLDMRFEQ